MKEKVRRIRTRSSIVGLGTGEINASLSLLLEKAEGTSLSQAWGVAQVNGNDTADVRAGHGSTRNGTSLLVVITNPGGGDGSTRSENVGTFAVVGERAALIDLLDSAGGEGGGTDGDGGFDARGRTVAGVGVIVTSGNNHQEASGDGGLHGVIESKRGTAAERHVSDGGLASGLLLVGGPVDTIDDTRVGTATVVAEHLDGEDVGLLGKTPLVTDSSGSDVGSVSVLVSVGGSAHSVVAPESTSGVLEVLMGDLDASIDDVDVDAVAIVGVVVEVVVDVIGAGGGDTILAPANARLLLVAHVNEHDLVGLNKLDEGLFQQSRELAFGQLGSEALEGIEDFIGLEGREAGSERGKSFGGGRLVQHNNVVIGVIELGISVVEFGVARKSSICYSQ